MDGVRGFPGDFGGRTGGPSSTIGGRTLGSGAPLQEPLADILPHKNYIQKFSTLEAQGASNLVRILLINLAPGQLYF